MNTSLQDIRTAFQNQRERGLRAREAAEALGMGEGAAMAAHCGASGGPLRALPLKPDWLGLLQSLQVCGPLMALTRNDAVVHEKTGIYQKVSANGHVGLALGEDIDLRLFFNQWHAGFAVFEALKSQPGEEAPPSLQFFDRHGAAVHKIFVREQTDLAAWRQVVARFEEPARETVFEPPEAVRAPAPVAQDVDAEAFAAAWEAMTDTHQFFGLLKRFGLERQQGFRLVEGRYAHRVVNAAVRELLVEAAFDGTPVMVFVGSPGCIQIHTGPVKRVEPMEVHGKTWLNVLDPGFNLHLREDLIQEVWVVEKPTSDGVVTSVEAFDAHGGLMAMFFGARKPGQAELDAWRQIVAHLPAAGQPVAA
ncbi:ChuX/HutX family heme-like substrate-binding protein [Hydrogenophaga sp.]|uniref:hemin-degrading factor n=1 Tax=Hydrogenophaga sp. TaxID=1904254 RepID=UPI0026364052|nr:ChuX/HutX family heme-like substrate-binding protein [Hydrogenophaga sp.]MCW5654760.1 hemin-degrading factor [Hydrogenophaga sp.]